MKFRPIAAALATVTTIFITTATASYGLAFAHAHPLPDQQRQAHFDNHNLIANTIGNNQSPAEMNVPFIFDSNAQGSPELSDVLAKEKSASIAMDAILRSESLMRAISGASTEFSNGLTLILPTNKAFQALDEIPDDIELVMERHFIPQTVALQEMEEGVTVTSYKRLATLRFTSSHGQVYVQADQRTPTMVHGVGIQAGRGMYFLVDELFV
ncbi:hypothetical protein GGI25_000338 [Coemansia spiralis]|uniref:FAS1 domain-containing protein n=2 Tax=Coemansia TaxID=4863 RepID=A0A9W8GE87_9FUNG|nr:hypothetical protein BX070DRAFT_221574 [Coemansia spiralis]KAJ1996275.1 hypothetical protein EDC05_000165 [Coemansia umbellata]KAJ2625967.1 hypothetical protein GGI26_000051 [Coemansia sp. RSA 1358]KAJ2680703.1 hypothetical protein GGI25_000338 [Coemansia spiralis]